MANNYGSNKWRIAQNKKQKREEKRLKRLRKDNEPIAPVNGEAALPEMPPEESASETAV